MSMWMRGLASQRPLALSFCNRAQCTTRRTFFNFLRSGQKENSSLETSTEIPKVRRRTRRPQKPVSSIPRQGGGVLAALAVVKEPYVGPMMVKLLSVCPPITAILVFLAPLPAIRKIAQDKTTGELPFLPYSSMLGCGIVWAIYGLLQGDATIYSPNLIGVVCGAYYMNQYIANCAPDFNYKLHTRGVQALTVWTLGCAMLLEKSTALTLIGLTGDAVVIALFGGPLIVIQSILKEKSTRNLPFEFTAVAFTNTLLWSGYGALVIHDPFVWIPNGIGLCFTTLQMSFFYRFGIQNAPLLGITPPTGPAEKKKKEMEM